MGKGRLRGRFFRFVCILYPHGVFVNREESKNFSALRVGKIQRRRKTGMFSGLPAVPRGEKLFRPAAYNPSASFTVITAGTSISSVSASVPHMML